MHIKERREAMHMTQAELAAAIGSRQNNISRYEQGTRMPDIRTAHKLAQLFGCSIDELLREPEEEAATAAA